MLHKYFSIFFILSFLVTAEAYARQSCDWRFRTSITINETSGTTTSNYSVKLTLTGSSGGNLNTDYDWSESGDDLRVFDSDDSTALNFSIDSWNASTKTAEVWVTLPVFTANESRSIYIYYDNENASSIAGTPPTTTYVLDKIKFHTRYNDDSINDPDSLASAKALFDAQDDSNSSYGCSHPDEYVLIRNSTQAPNPGTSVDFIAYSTALFTVPSDGVWGVRYGADYGLGGGLYIDGVAMDERWDEDLWWGGSNWNNSDVLTGVKTLSAGEHELEIIGAEGGNDGGLTIQFRSPDGTWSSDATTLGIEIRSESCPTVRHTIEYGAHDECGVDLRIRGTGADLSVPSVWEKNAPQDITFSVRNTPQGTATSSSPIDVTVSVPADFTLIESVGTDWSNCTQVGDLISCQYNNALDVSSNSDSITLTLLPGDSATVGSDDIVIEVFSTFYDVAEGNNTASTTITIEDNDVVASVSPSCSPQEGVWARFFNTDGYFSSSADAKILNETAMQTFVDDNKNSAQLDGQTIFSNINGDENPFNDDDTDPSDENFLAIFEGYIKVPATDDYTFGVNGDDALEFRLGGIVRSTFYDLHGESSTPQGATTIRLAEGYHAIEYRMQEHTGRAAYRLYSSAGSVTLTSTDITPDSYFYHCAGDPNIQISSSVSVTSDDIHGTTAAKAIPNAIMKYTVTGTNQGSISTNSGSTIITQTIDSDNKLFVKDLNGSGEGPIHFTSIDSSGLSYQYDSSAGDDNLWFSTDDGSTYTETIDLTEDYNESVTHFQIRFDGSLKAKFDSTEHSFTFEYQARVK